MPDPSTGSGSRRAEAAGRWRSALNARLARLRLTPAREREIVDELSQHLDDIYADLRARGASHEEAMTMAMDELDDNDLLAREMRPLKQASVPPPIVPGAPRGNWARDAIQDTRYAVRVLLQSPAWTFVIILLLALGIGANTALFSATDALLFTSLNVRDPGSLVRFRWAGRNDMATDIDEWGYSRPAADGRPTRSVFSHAVFQELSADASGKADLTTFCPVGEVNLVIDGHADLAEAFLASGNYYQLLGVSAREGRTLTPADDRPSASPVAVISSKYWQSRFGGDPSIVGKTVKANDVLVTIVGVLPGDFTGVQETLAEPADISFPLTLDTQLHASAGRTEASALGRPTWYWLNVMGRLRPGVTADALQAALDGPFKRTARANFDTYLKGLSEDARQLTLSRRGGDAVPRLLVESGRRGIYDVYTDSITSARILFAVVGVILLIVCANVANLMLSRAVARRREISVRLSLGATRTRLLRQLLTEALLLAVAGAALGLAVAYWGVRLLPPPAADVSIFHGSVLLFATGAAVVTSVLFGVVPALRATRVDVNAALKETGRTIAGRRSLLARSLLIVQVALSVLLLVAAGLFLRTLANLRHVDVGFSPDNLLLVQLTPEVSGYDRPRMLELYRTLDERLGSLPGVRGAALSQPALLSGSVSSTDIYLEGEAAPADIRAARSEHSINRLVVSPDFFAVYGIPIVMGRGLTAHDDQSAPHVAVINEAAVRTYFHGRNPIGTRFGSDPGKADIEVVGVVRDAKYSDIRSEAPPTMYVTYLQAPRAVITVAVRAITTPVAIAPAVRQAIHDIDPNLPIAKMSTQLERIDDGLKQERLFADACTLFGAIALLLASVGLFGLMSYNVARRTSEMGIRMALGAQRGRVLTMVLRESMLLVGIGVAVGLALAIAASRLIATLLFGLGTFDPATVAGAVLVMAAVSAIAAYLPARRASRVDPMVALRYE